MLSLSRLLLHLVAALLVACICCGVLVPGYAFAVEPSERLVNPLLENRARAISAELRCLVCQNQSIDDSSAPLARDLRVLVREQLLAGNSDADIMRFLVDRYGEFVLLRPRLSPQTALLWLSPLLLLVMVGFAMWRRVRTMTADEPDPARGLSSDETKQLDHILAGEPKL